MIKSFKDFDGEVKSQKIYEAVDDIEKNDTNIFTEEDVVVPEMVYNNVFLLKISKIVKKKLAAANIGQIGIHPMIVNIDGVPGVYFYNYDDPTMNIVICRNTNGKNVYLFKEFKIGKNNIADLVLTTKTLGFTDIIDALIHKFSTKSIDESLICEWVEGDKLKKYDEAYVALCNDLDVTTRIKIATICKKSKNLHSAREAIWNLYLSEDASSIDIFTDVQTKVLKGKKDISKGAMDKLTVVFYFAVHGETEHEEVLSVLKDTPYEGGSTEIVVRRDVETDISDGADEAYDEAHEIKLKKDEEKYRDELQGMYDLASAMCTYVKKQGKLDKDERSALYTHGMLITGSAGVGKSASVKRALKEAKMRENIDYYEVSSGSTSAQEIYKKLYDYNGKIIIFDDSGAVFDTEYKQGLWKHAFEPDPENRSIAFPIKQSIGGKPSETSGTYDPTSVKSRQARYFLEVGHTSPKEEEEFRKIQMEKLAKEYRDKEGYSMKKLPAYVTSDHEKIVDKLWDAELEKRSPKMPTNFKYKGCAIIITNKSRDRLKKEIEADNWGAIAGRMACFDVHPMPETIWKVIKEQIEDETKNEKLDDDLRMIPKDYAELFIAEVEANLATTQYRVINFRIVADYMHNTLNGAPGRKEWQKRLKRYMDIKL